VASEDPHIPLSVWRDHGDAVGCRHDPWSSHRRHSYLWDGVSYQVEGLRQTSNWPSAPAAAPNQKDRKTTGVHSRWLTAHFSTYPEGAEDIIVQRYVGFCISYMHDE
jgi:hypothetical protein